MIIGIIKAEGDAERIIAHHLAKKGFHPYSLEEELREEAQRRKVKPTPENLVQLEKNLRERFGERILAERVRIKLRENRNYVLTSFCNSDEVAVFSSDPSFVLISVVGNTRTEQRESNLAKEQVRRRWRLAKIVLKNDGTVEELCRKVDKLIFELHKKHYRRPSWDEYFLGIVDAVAKRATCDRGRTAVILVKDKRILATGYVGSPMGLAHCDEIGHQMKKVIHEAGNISQHCVRTNHAEINAISLAARNGVSIDGATLYCKLEPCYTCAKMIINAGIKRVVCQKQYHAADDSRKVFKQAKIQFDVLERKVEEYPLQ